MIFTATVLPDSYLIDLEKREDSRGFFARTWCEREFGERGLVKHFVQHNVSRSRRAGTLRGMHYQVAPDAEVKVIRCTHGSIYDVIVDLRPRSPTYCKWLGVELSAANYRMVYVPTGFAHGFLSLEDDTEVAYQVSAFYAPACERGVRFDDPHFGIVWPAPIQVISDKDRCWPYYRPETGDPLAVGGTPHPSSGDHS